MGKTYFCFICLLFLLSISLISCKNSASGPEQPTEEPKSDSPKISSIQPESGIYGTPVTIIGEGFSTDLSSIMVDFNGREAEVDSAGPTVLYTKVPEEATTGIISVRIGGLTAEGPEFEVITTGAVEVIVSTSGPDQDRDGYKVNINNQKSLESSINDTLLIENIEQGSQLLGVEGLDNACTVSSNPRSISVVAQDTTQEFIEVQCEEVVLKNKIVYRHCEGICEGLYIIDSDGSNPIQLTSHSWDLEPVISPDGTKVAFVNGRRNPDVSEHHNEIYIVDASGYPITHIARPPESLHDNDPSWSPDGEKLIFSQNNATGYSDIVTVNADGTDRTKLTNDRADDSWPLYTPDGSKIVFYSLNRGGNSQIFLMNSDGTNVTKLTDNDFFIGHLALSNDGSMLAFEVQGDPQQIYVMNIDGTGIRPVTNDSNGYAFASWSPDDSQLIFYNFGMSDISKINLDGSGLTNLTNTPEVGEPDPYWSPVE